MSSELYTFTDRTDRVSRVYEDVSQYQYDPALGNDVEATILVKWDNQRDHDNNLRTLAHAGWNVARGNALAPSPRDRHRYFGGFIVRTTLDQNEISASTVEPEPALQPTGAATRRDGLTAYACGNRLLLSTDGSVNNVSAIIDNPMFARLHSVAFSHDGHRLLTASSSLDMIYEVSVADGEVMWSMDLWAETPYNTNILGQSFYREQTPETTGFVLNPSSFDLKDNEQLRGAQCVVDNPEAYKNLGLATALTPVFINTVDYEGEDTVLATSFSKGQAWKINRRSRQVEVVAKNLGRPHGLHTDSAVSGYLVTDTLGERAIFLNMDFEDEVVLDFSRLTDRKEGLENSAWMQYTSELKPGLYCAVMTSRQKLTLFDRQNKVRRDIDIDPDWGIQLVVPR
ncbi:MAG: hypothetical protein ABWY71_02800 [Candidatus Saccharimonadales bacterium]